MQPNKIYNHRTLSKMIGYGYTRAVRDGVPIKARAFVSMMNGFIEWVFGDGCAKDVVTVEGLKWSKDIKGRYYRAVGYNRDYVIDIQSDYITCLEDQIEVHDTLEEAKQACQDHYNAQVLDIIRPLCSNE